MSLLINGVPTIIETVPINPENPLDRFSSYLSREIFSYLRLSDLGTCQRVSKQWNALASDKKLRKKALARTYGYGQEKWAKYFGDIGPEPTLPDNIEEILKSPCPFVREKRVFETHMLVLIPKIVDKIAYTLKHLTELMKKPKKGKKTCFRSIWEGIFKEFGDTTIEESYWVLITKDDIPRSRAKPLHVQQSILARFPNYQLPSLLEASTGIVMDFVSTGKRRYSDTQWTSIRCREVLADGLRIIIGGFVRAGIRVKRNENHAEFYLGIAALRKLT